MLTPYTPAEHAKRMAAKRQPGLPRERSSYAHENSTRQRVRLSIERSKRQASKVDASLAERLRQRAVSDLANLPYDWERDRRTEFALNGPSENRRGYR